MIKTYISEIEKGRIKLVVKKMEEKELEDLPVEESEIRSDEKLGENETPTPEEEPKTEPEEAV